MSSTKGLITKQYLSDIAAAIRSKLGVQTQYTPAQMASAISSIPTGVTPTLIAKNITANGTYNAQDDSADGYSQVVANVPFKSKFIPSGSSALVTSDGKTLYVGVVATDTVDLLF